MMMCSDLPAVRFRWIDGISMAFMVATSRVHALIIVILRVLDTHTVSRNCKKASSNQVSRLGARQ